MFEKNSLLTLADNNEYVVVDKYEENGTIYVYLVDINNNQNTIFGKLDNDEIVKITDIDELERMVKKLDQNIINN